ncbi:MAG: MBL fold metallo-hydrolase [Acidobacteria bacterium]|nr:MBL fold metallo-hydrolase [Acidobacteriota bacterium]
MQITFRGAARTVTGSMHEIQSAGKRIVLDCGLYQGRRKEAAARNRNFPFPPSEVDAVLLSHAHIDHSGNLPNLVKRGFSGPIFTTPATIDLCASMLQDSAFIQEKDAEFLNRRNSRRKRILDEEGNGQVEPLYTVEDAKRTIPMFKEVKMHTRTEVLPGVFSTAHEAGHMLGSTFLFIEAEGKRLLFSGDIGRKNLPIIRDPERALPADILIVESTYGDRLHQPLLHAKEKLAHIINTTARRGGKIIAPAFAVGRTQQLVLMIHELIREGKLHEIPVFVDSPLAVNVTEAFRKHTECFDIETKTFLDDGADPFGFRRLRYVRDVEDSKALNDLRVPCVIISASGMAEAGRVLHHLRNNVSDSRNTVLIAGFQAENTLGRKLLEGEKEVNIFGDPVRVRCEVTKINELSGHADQQELLAWMEPLVSSVRHVFLVHGEYTQQQALALAIQERYDVPVTIPDQNESFTV